MRISWLLATVFALSPVLAMGQTTEELNNDGKDTDNVLTQSMGLSRQNYSPLAEINKSNVKRLVPIWSTSLMNDSGELAAPVVYDGVIYAINAKWTFAIDVATGRQIWRTPVQNEPGNTRAANAIYRGAPAIYNGKLFRVTVDNHLVALDLKDGRVLWNQKFAEWKEGYHSSGAPIVANGVLISGMAGGESTTRGFLDGWNPDTGEKLWRRYTIPAPGEPGSETWPANSDAWKYGGGPTWRSGSYDPQLDLVYWGTGNAEPYDPRPRQGLDSLYTSSVLAIRPKTGEIACYYQYTPNDVYDVDGTDEQVLADLRINGEMRKVMIQSNKNGFMYVVDRTNCKLITAHPYTKVNWASGIDPASGRPLLTGVYKDFLAGSEVRNLPVTRLQCGADRIQSDEGDCLCCAVGLAAHPAARAAQAVRDRRQHDRRQCTPADDHAWRGGRLLHRPGPDHRTAEMGTAADRDTKLRGHAGHRGRAGIHRKTYRRIFGARRGHRKDTLAIPDQFGRQFDGRHLHAWRPAIRDGCVRSRRHPRAPRRQQQGADWRIALDLRPDAAVAAAHGVPCRFSRGERRNAAKTACFMSRFDQGRRRKKEETQ